MSKIIRTTTGQELMVDDEDYLRANEFNWQLSLRGYVRRCDKHGETIYLGRSLMFDLPEGKRVGYRNGDHLDFRRSNLIACDRVGAKWRHRVFKPSSRFMGVFESGTGRWIASLSANLRSDSIRTFKLEEDAARAYDLCARHVFGPSTRTNFPGTESMSVKDAKKWFKERNSLKFKRAEIVKNEPKPRHFRLKVIPYRVRRGPSRFIGVWWDYGKQRWRAGITVRGFTIHLGHFATEEEASDVYQAAVIKYRGDRKVWNTRSSDREKSLNKIRVNRHRAKRSGFVTAGDFSEYRKFVLFLSTAEDVKCWWCGEPAPKSDRHIDHVFPIAKGGADHVVNLCCSCEFCNRKKKDKLPHEFTGQFEIDFGRLVA